MRQAPAGRIEVCAAPRLQEVHADGHQREDALVLQQAARARLAAPVQPPRAHGSFRAVVPARQERRQTAAGRDVPGSRRRRMACTQPSKARAPSNHRLT